MRALSSYTQVLVGAIAGLAGPCAMAAIARKADFTPEKVAFFLRDPHPKMPNFPLSRSEAADIAAYIGTLRK
jgi:mono/diheme cytochrome c family protein